MKIQPLVINILLEISRGQHEFQPTYCLFYKFPGASKHWSQAHLLLQLVSAYSRSSYSYITVWCIQKLYVSKLRLSYFAKVVTFHQMISPGTKPAQRSTCKIEPVTVSKHSIFSLDHFPFSFSNKMQKANFLFICCFSQ